MLRDHQASVLDAVDLRTAVYQGESVGTERVLRCVQDRADRGVAVLRVLVDRVLLWVHDLGLRLCERTPE